MIASYIRRGYGRSFRAAIAEAEGKLPASRLSLSRSERAIFDLARSLALVVPDEWHHTGKYARRTDYWSAHRVRGFLRTHQTLSAVGAALARREARRAARRQPPRTRLERLREEAAGEINWLTSDLRWFADTARAYRHFTPRAVIAARRLDKIHSAAVFLDGGVFYRRNTLRRLHRIAVQLFRRI